MKTCLLTMAAAASCVASAAAWDAAGHMLVGQIAWEKTQPAARARVTELVATLEATYNDGQPYNFITAGCWMDDMRSKKGYAWSKWHYVNLPWTADGKAFELPPPPHVVWAIDESLNTLKSPRSPDAQLSEALGMLIHLIGDVHQPMHATDRNDRGGNGVLIRGIPFTDLWPGTVANLHAYWDKAFRFDAAESQVAEIWKAPPVGSRPKAPGEGIIAGEAAKIMLRFPRERFADFHPNPAYYRAPGVHTITTRWARESHAIGCRSGYPPDGEPSDHRVATLTPEFVHASRKIAEERVALAGYRLARVLNELFPETASAAK